MWLPEMLNQMQNQNYKKNLSAFLKIAAFSALISSVAIVQRGAFAEDAPSDFKFPLSLCVFKVSRVKDVGGKPHVKSEDFTGEFAYRVENVQALNTRDQTGRMVRVYTGDFGGTYEIPDSLYRIRFEGNIRQGGDQLGTQPLHEMSLQSFLEKKDLKSGLYVVQGQNNSHVQTTAQADGSVWENVFSYAKNESEFSSVLSLKKGILKVDSTKLLDAVRDGAIDMGSVAQAGPVCGLLDVNTAARITSHRDQFKDLFKHIPMDSGDRSANTWVAAVSSLSAESAQSNVMAKPTQALAVKDDGPAHPAQMTEVEEAAERAEQERLANGEDITKPAVGTPDELQEVVRQNQLADAEASRYAQESANANSASLAPAVPESSDSAAKPLFDTPPTVAWPTTENGTLTPVSPPVGMEESALPQAPLLEEPNREVASSAVRTTPAFGAAVGVPF